MADAREVTHRNINAPWQKSQRHCFLGWLNFNLAKCGEPPVNDLTTCFKNGVVLYRLLKFLSKKEVGKVNVNPTLKVQEVENVSICLNFLKNEGIYLENIGPIDIYEENYTIIMGLLWTIILHYQVAGVKEFSMEHQEKEATKKRVEQAKKDLLAWCKLRCAAHGVDVRDFRGSWADGSAFSSLIATIHKDYNYWQHENDSIGDKMDSAFDFAENPLEIPQLLESETMLQDQDEKSIVTYLSIIYEKYKDYPILVSERLRNYTFEFEGIDLDGDGNGRAYVDVQKSFRTIVKQGDAAVALSPDSLPQFVLKGPNGNVPVSVSLNPDGTLDSKFTATASGPHVLEVYMDGRLLQSQTINVRDPYLDCTGPGLVCGSVGAESSFNVFLREGEGGHVIPSAEHLGVHVTDLHGNPVPVHLSQNADGSTRVSYTPTSPGSHKVALSYRGKPLKEYSVPVYQLDFVDFDGADKATVGVISSFSLGVRGPDGYVYPEGLNVTLRGPSGEILCDSRKVDGGLTQFCYTPTVVGEHTLEVSVGGVVLRQAPVNVRDLQIDWEGDGLAAATVGFPSSFNVTFRDADGNICNPADAKVQISGPNGLVEPLLHRNEDGTFTVTYIPNAAGEHSVQLLVNGKVVKAAKVPVFDISIDFSAFDRDEDGNVIAVVDVPKVANVSVRSQDGLVGLPPGLSIVFEDDSESQGFCESKALANGTVACTLCATQSGPHTLKVKYGDVVLQTTPVIVKDLFVESVGDGLKCGLVKSAMPFVTTFRERPNGPVVFPRGNFTVRITASLVEAPILESSSSSLSVPQKPRRRSSNSQIVAADLNEREDGSTDVRYVAHMAVVHVVLIVYRGTPLQTFDVPIYDFEFFGLDGLGGNVATVGVRSSFGLGVKNANGYVYPDGLEVVLKGPSGEIVCDSKRTANGFTELSYVPTVSGEHTLEVRIGGVKLRDTPVSVVDPSVRIEGKGAEFAILGAESEFTVACFDAHNNPISGSDLVVTLTTRDGTIPVRAVCGADGVLRCCYVSSSIGDITLSVSKGGEIIYQSIVDAVGFEVSGLEWKYALKGIATLVNVQMRSGEEKRLAASLSKVTAALRSPRNATPCEVIAAENAAFSGSVVVIPVDVGEQTLEISYQGSVFYSSPIHVLGAVLAGDGLKEAFLGFPANFSIVLGVEGVPIEALQNYFSPQFALFHCHGSLNSKPLDVVSSHTDVFEIRFSYTPKAAGKVGLLILHNNHPYAQSAVTVIEPKWTVTGSSTRFAKCGMENYFHVSAVDPRNGTSLLRNIRERVKCNVKDPSDNKVDARLQWDPQGGLGGVFVPAAAGDHKVEFTIDGNVVHSFVVPTYRYEFEGDGMMGCCCKMPAYFKLEIYAQEGSPPIQPNDVVTMVKYAATDTEIPTTITKNASEIRYDFTPISPGDLLITVDHKGEIVYSGKMKVSIPRFTFQGEGAVQGVIGKESPVQIIQTHPFTLVPIPQNLFFVKAIMKDPTMKVLPMKKKTTLEGDYSCLYMPKIKGKHQIELTCDGANVHQDTVPHPVEVVGPEDIQPPKGAEAEGEKGVLKVYLEKDEVLSTMNLSNTFKMLSITSNSKTGDVKRLMIDKMIKSLDEKQVAVMVQHCSYFCIAEVPVDAEERKARKLEKMKRYENAMLRGIDNATDDPTDDDVIDPEGRRLLRNEVVWPWRHEVGKKFVNSAGVETILVFKKLMGHLDFFIKYPKRGVTGEVLSISMKIRDPANGNCLVNNHKGELVCHVRLPNGEYIDVSGEKGIGDGEHCIPFVPSTPGVHFLMLVFNEANVHEKQAKINVYERSSVSVVNRILS